MQLPLWFINQHKISIIMKRSGAAFIVVSVFLLRSKTSRTNDRKPKNCVEMKRVALAVEKVEKVAKKAIGRQERQTESKEQ